MPKDRWPVSSLSIFNKMSMNSLYFTKFIYAFMMEQVALNKSSLLPKIQTQSTQTLQLFTKIIKTESIYKSN
jgi:hypothetical protein